MILHASAWGKRQRTRTGRGPDAGRTLEFEQTDADRAWAWPRARARVRLCRCLVRFARLATPPPLDLKKTRFLSPEVKGFAPFPRARH
eukprot:gene20020-biopygen14601